MTNKQRVSWLALWCAENGLALEQKGEVGFGRECVGIMKGNSYIDVDYGYSCDPLDAYEITRELSYPAYPEVWNAFYPEILNPGDLAPDAYHKHDCLAILGRGTERVKQLYEWTKVMVDAGAVIQTVERRSISGSAIELLMHGVTRTRLALPEQPKTHEEAAESARRILAVR